MERVAILLPTHNEEDLLEESVNTLLDFRLPQKDVVIVIAENGSTDETKRIARRLAKTNPRVRTFSLTHPGYGRALKKAIMHTQCDDVVVFNVDYFDLSFLRKSMTFLKTHDIIAGSKLLYASRDQRNLLRKLATRVLTLILKSFFDFRGSDTHGLKVMRRSRILPIVRESGELQELFDTELMLRAERRRLRIKYLPVIVQEKRTSVVSFSLRILSALKELLSLWIALRNLPEKSR